MILSMEMFLVVEKGQSQDVVTYPGEYKLFPMNTPIPIIVKGKGCVGTTRIERLIFQDDGTIVELGTIEKMSPEALKSFYDLYRMRVSSNVSTNDTLEANEDAVIPGLYRRSSNVVDDDEDDAPIPQYRRSKSKW